MRFILLVLFMGLSVTFSTAQHVSNDSKEMTERARQTEFPSLKPFDQTLQKKQLQESMKVYICQRCGSENHINWNKPFSSSAFLPHCDACGKKYWPKFKPSSAIKRMYCSIELEPHLQTN